MIVKILSGNVIILFNIFNETQHISRKSGSHVNILIKFQFLTMNLTFGMKEDPQVFVIFILGFKILSVQE